MFTVAHQHLDTRITLSQSAAEDLRLKYNFQKTFDYKNEYIDRAHHRLALSSFHSDGHMINVGIEGWLLVADALKLYELAYCCEGDILELGTYKGLSTSILAEAAHNSGRQFNLVTVDLDPNSSGLAKNGMEQRRSAGSENCHFFVFEGGQFVRNLAAANRRFELVFVDHSHCYEHVLEVCKEMQKITQPGSFVIFHDYNDPRNGSADNKNYGVFQGVADGLSPDLFQFYGVYGCTGLFRKNLT